MKFKFSIASMGLLLLSCQTSTRECSDGGAYLSPFAESKVDQDNLGVMEASGEANVLYNLECLRKAASSPVGLPTEILESQVELYSLREENLIPYEKSDDPCVVGVSEAKVFYQIDTPINPVAVDPQASSQDHLRALKMSEIDKALTGAKNPGREVIVAVIDTGVDLTHEDLVVNKWTNTKEIAGNNIDDDKNGYIDDINGYNFASKKGASGPEGSFSGVDHGTHVAGLIAAVEGNEKGGKGIRGRQVKIMSLNVFGKSAGASLSNIENAIRYAADNGAHIINMSLGGPGKSASTESALIYGIEKGVLIVTAAGNDGRELTSTYFFSPASYGEKLKGMINVGSSDSKTGKLSSFSNRSSKYVEVLAPGSEDSARRTGLLSTFIGNKYGRMEGTSMASPVAAGVAALLKAYLPANRVTAKLLEDEFLSVRKVENDKKNSVLGGGVLDLSLVSKAISIFVNTLEVPVVPPNGPELPEESSDNAPSKASSPAAAPTCQ